MKLFVTSIGSLVGQNIIEALETRRSEIELIGANTGAQHPRVFKADRLYRLPETGDRAAYFKALVPILEKEEPDLILAGRDQDTVELAHFKKSFPAFETMIPAGDPRPAEIMQDKWESFEWSVRNGLPFAKTLDLKRAGKANVQRFAQEVGFPMIAKLIDGFGSNGVYFVFSEDDCFRMKEQGHFILQEYLDPDPNLSTYVTKYKVGVPLFFQIPEKKQFASQMVIGKDGQFSDIFVSVNQMVLGRCEYSERWSDQTLVDLTKKAAAAFYRDGWYGSLNIQWKPDRTGAWKIIEFNPRMTGSTSARFRMGFDEIGILCSFFASAKRFRNLTDISARPCYNHRTLSDTVAYYDDIEQFNRDGFWSKP